MRPIHLLLVVFASACSFEHFGVAGGGASRADASTGIDAITGSADAAPAAVDATIGVTIDATLATVDAGGSCPPDPTPPGGPTCPTECTGGCGPGNVCTIACGPGQCDGNDIVCPPEYACSILCVGTDACDVATVLCPPSHACTVMCEGDDACGDLTMQCGSGSCSIECGVDQASCSGATVVCGPGACSATCIGTSTPSMSGCTSSCGCDPC